MKTIFLVALFILYNSYAQQSLNKIQFLTKNEINTHYTTLKKETKNRIKNVEGKYKSQEKNIYKNKLKSIKTVLGDSLYITKTSYNTRINKVLKNIQAVNPEIKNDTYILLLNTNFIPNAASHGIHLIEINLGLFTLIENDDELAFIICHEIAHEKLNHLGASIQQVYNSHYSKENKQKINSISKLESGKANAAINELKKLNYKISKNFRKHEIEADSLGFAYFENTSYNLTSANSILDKLGKVEEILLSHQINWKKTFNISEKEFEQTSSTKGLKFIDNEYTIDTDSLRTHPNIKDRILKIQTSFIQQENNPFHFKKDQLKVFKLYIEIAKLNKSLVSNFYLNSMLYSMYPKESYYLENLKQLIDEIYLLKKEHQIGKYVSFDIDNETHKNIYQINDFINNTELYHLKQIKNYLKKQL